MFRVIQNGGDDLWIFDMYHELMSLQLRLFWKLQIFKRLIKSGDGEPQNIKAFKEACDRWDGKWNNLIGTDVFFPNAEWI